MSEAIISVENLGKRYVLGAGAERERYVALRDVLTNKVKGMFRSRAATENERRSRGEFWALDDVSFEVQRGEIVGIIGRNGAGKSTLLKILSRITEPTRGRVTILGRVASLLEVGTGFHPELTGRENIFLNGAILGMTRLEIKKKFDEIVAFAEVERFLDTPVKRYSSGMYVRLAFAVAAHLEPEILIVDEVLAVGDVQFQKKCLGKMSDASRAGKTVLFVSHSMPAVLRLCNRVILLEQGKLVADGLPDAITGKFLTSGTDRGAERIWSSPDEAPGDKIARLRAVRTRNSKGVISETIDISETFEIEIEYWNLQDRLKPTVSMHLVNEEGVTLFVSNDFSNPEWWSTPRKPGLVRARCRVPGHLLSEGRHYVLGAVCTFNPDVIHALERDAVSFQAVDQYDLERTREKFAGSWPGAMRPRLEWQVEEIGS